MTPVVVVAYRDKKLLGYVIGGSSFYFVPLIDGLDLFSLVVVQISILSRDAEPQKILITLFRLRHVSCVLVRATWHQLVHKTRTGVSIQTEVAVNSVARRLIWPRTAD
jgi:hypothetical protein